METKGSARSQLKKMATTPVTPKTHEEYPIQRSVYDFKTLQNVKIQKTFNAPIVTDLKHALELAAGDHAKVSQWITEGLVNEYRRKANASQDGWFVESATGELTPFSGNFGNQAAVMALRLQMAKALFDYDPKASKEARDKSLNQAMDLIRNTPAILNRIIESSATETDETETPDETETA